VPRSLDHVHRKQKYGKNDVDSVELAFCGSIYTAVLERRKLDLSHTQSSFSVTRPDPTGQSQANTDPNQPFHDDAKVEFSKYSINSFYVVKFIF